MPTRRCDPQPAALTRQPAAQDAAKRTAAAVQKSLRAAKGKIAK